MHTTLAEEHLYIRFVGLWIQVINKKDGKINLFPNHHGGNLRIAAQWP
jgi:hypothetical protein